MTLDNGRSRYDYACSSIVFFIPSMYRIVIHALLQSPPPENQRPNLGQRQYQPPQPGRESRQSRAVKMRRKRKKRRRRWTKRRLRRRRKRSPCLLPNAPHAPLQPPLIASRSRKIMWVMEAWVLQVENQKSDSFANTETTCEFISLR